MNRAVRLKNIIGAILVAGFVGLAVATFIIYTKQLRKIEQMEADLETTRQSLIVRKNRLSETKEKSTLLNAENVDLIKRTVLQREYIKEIQKAKEDMGKKIKVISTEKEEGEVKLTEMEQLLQGQITLHKRKENELEENFQKKLNSGKNKFINEKKMLGGQIEAAAVKLEILARENEILLAELNKSKERLAEFEQGSMVTKLEKEISKLNRTAKENKRLIRQNEKTFAEVNREKEKIVKQLKQTEEKLKRETLRFHYNLGLFYDKTKQYKDALVEYQKALAITPDDPDIHYNLAVIYDDHFSDKKRAVKHYQAYLRLSPEAEDIDRVSYWILKAQEELEWGK